MRGSLYFHDDAPNISKIQQINDISSEVFSFGGFSEIKQQGENPVSSSFSGFDLKGDSGNSIEAVKDIIEMLDDVRKVCNYKASVVQTRNMSEAIAAGMESIDSNTGKSIIEEVPDVVHDLPVLITPRIHNLRSRKVVVRRVLQKR